MMMMTGLLNFMRAFDALRVNWQPCERCKLSLIPIHNESGQVVELMEPVSWGNHPGSASQSHSILETGLLYGRQHRCFQ